MSQAKDDFLERSKEFWNPGKTADWQRFGVDLVIDRREGYFLYDMDGKRLIDVHLNGGTYNVGHRNPEVVRAVREGMDHFDIGNHHSRGGATEWLRAIGPRIVKLDVKGHSTERRKNCDIFDGDIPWDKVREEIDRIQFSGWATAEVSGGGEARLRQVVQRMNRALGIA